MSSRKNKPLPPFEVGEHLLQGWVGFSCLKRDDSVSQVKTTRSFTDLERGRTETSLQHGIYPLAERSLSRRSCLLNIPCFA